ncbi:hypothetical protein CPC08DRAFT_717402 [Agrocybe pediades]|nr:hypothetical protein CPC08DRAFT_717402 [Agrocybe pediades]
MQASRDEPPISVLHEDVLWNIFLFNTDFDIYYPFEHNPLTTARHCSQGRLVDIEDLEKKKSGWKKEVLARSGEDLLWVYARHLSEAQRDFS